MEKARHEPREVLRAEGVGKTYPSAGGPIEVLRGVDLTVHAGESVSIRGVSGCGKTTLLNILAGLESVDTGEVYWRGRATSRLSRGALATERGTGLGMVFQSYYLVPELNAFENVLLAARLIEKSGPEERARAEALIERVGLKDRRKSLPSQLSGGERQRVAIARALLNRPGVLLADEPTGNLDEHTAGGVLDLLLEVCAEQRAALVLVTHSRAFAARTARACALHLGELQLATGETAEV